MTADLVQVYQFPGQAQIQHGLIDFAEGLRKTWPASKLGVMTLGWSSPKGDWEGSWLCPELLDVKNYFRDRLPSGDWELIAWFNILEPGGTIGLHNHYQAEFAIAYHVKGEGGLLVDYGDKSDMIPAVPGRMALFPGTLMHSVPQPVPSRRYSISINAHKRRP